jgi:hypothetical protein
MSRRVEALLETARQVEVGEPPPLAAIRSEAGVRARRSAYLAAFALALPLGAAAAAGGWAFKQRMENTAPTVEKHVRPRVEVPHGVAPVAVTVVQRPDVPVVGGSQPSEPERGRAAPVADASPSSTRRAAVHELAEAPRAAVRAVPVATPAEAERSPTRSTGEGEPSSVDGTAAPTGTIGHSGPASGPQQPQFVEAPARTGLSDEAAQLTALVSTLRQQHDPAATLVLVAQYRAKFPSGALRTEVTLVAAEAHRALGHSADALAELEKVGVDARGGELTVLRAELRAELHHCAEALAELDAVRGRLSPTLRERAERVEASCR